MSEADYSVVAVARAPQVSSAPTLSELGPLRGSFSWVEDTREPGSATVTVNTYGLPSDIKGRLLDIDTYPTEVWVYRNSALVFAGPIVSLRVVNSVVTLTCRDLLFYLAYMLVPTDKTWAATDQNTIVGALVDDWQALDYGNYGIDTSGIGTSGTLRTLDIAGATEYPVVLDEVLLLAGSDGGFDPYVDPTTRDLTLYSPLRGTDRSASVFLERGIATPDISMSVAPGAVASEVYAVGTGPGVDPALVSTASDTGLRASFGRAGAARRFDPVIAQAHLDDLAAYEVGLLASKVVGVAPGVLLPVSDAQYGDFGVGDIVTYSFDSGLGVHTAPYRISKRQVSIGADGVETMSVEFE